jgi:hypothetical protein
MKSIAILALVALCSAGLHADVKVSTNAAGNTLWYRNGAVRLIRYKETKPGRTTYLASHGDLKDSKPTYGITVVDGVISKVTPWAGAKGREYILHDLDKDGAQDVIEILDPKRNETLECYMLVAGRLEPVPDIMFIETEPNLTKVDYEALTRYLLEEKKPEPNQRLQTMRFKLPMNAISQGPHV